MSETLEPRNKEAWPGVTMERIIDELLHSTTVPEQPREYIIQGKITATHLRALTDLPYEVSIDEQKGQLILSTGLEGEAVHAWNHDAKRRAENGRVSFHTHPLTEGETVNTPSLSDLHVQRPRSRKNLSSIIAHPKGMLVYTYILDTAPRQEEQSEEYIKMSRAISQMESLIQEFRNEQLTFAEAIREQRRLFEESGLLVCEADWNDGEGINKILSMFEVAKKR